MRIQGQCGGLRGSYKGATHSAQGEGKDRVARMEEREVARMQGRGVMRMQGCKVVRIKGQKVMGMQGHKVTRMEKTRRVGAHRGEPYGRANGRKMREGRVF